MPIAGLSPKEVVHAELHKFKHNQLHSGSHHGPLVKSRPQAIAIALSESRKAKGRAMGGFTPWFGGMNAPGGGPFAGGGLPWFGGMSPPAGSPAMGASPPSHPSASPPANPPPTATPMASPPAPIAGFGGSSCPPGRQFGGGMTRPPNPNWTVRNEARQMLHSGPINSIVPGRTDRHNVNVASGSYVMPADAVSHLGQNNSKAGQAILSHMFGGQGPYGMGKDMAVKHGPGAPRPPRPQMTAATHLPKFQSVGGGKGDRTGEPVPIVVAGGEFTIPPEAVAAVGGGDIKRGHKILDAWVLSLRKKHIATLKGLPGPAKA